MEDKLVTLLFALQKRHKKLKLLLKKTGLGHIQKCESGTSRNVCRRSYSH